jgi:hypothetical protein
MLQEEVLKFYEEAGWSSDKISVLRQKLSASVEATSRESPSVAEVLNTVRQLFNAELDLVRSEATDQHVLLRTEVETLKLDLSKTLSLLEDTSRKPLTRHTEPSFIYSYESNTDKLHRTSLITGEASCHRVISYEFKQYSVWSELPGGSLLITGGKQLPHSSREVVRIDSRTFEVSLQPAMITSRRSHAAVYHAQLLYVLGGWRRSSLRECERYVCAESRWETPPPLPNACYGVSGVVVSLCAWRCL